MVRFGFRVPSLSKRIAAKMSITRLVKNNLGIDDALCGCG
jgi:hypothetical protein